ncbi:BnaA10g28870D [Brassica napus]|uniref:BnaA10g28870D protein n=1 Tax=Brassica napus TaxID=3708 RepID=A0A078JSM6_BRANA|nr:BnaA10g28870D [Brassica napus]
MHSNEEFIKFLGEGSYGYVHLVRYTNPDEGGSSFRFCVNSEDIRGSSHVSETISKKASAITETEFTNCFSSTLPKVV